MQKTLPHTEGGRAIMWGIVGLSMTCTGVAGVCRILAYFFRQGDHERLLAPTLGSIVIGLAFILLMFCGIAWQIAAGMVVLDRRRLRQQPDPSE
jgi:hypothetical protein